VETTLIAAHLLRVEAPLDLDHPPSSERARRGVPAILVIPAGHGLTEPHLIVMTDPGHRPPPAGWVTTDVHLVAGPPGRREPAGGATPGVLVGRGGLLSRRVRAVADPGGDVVVGRRTRGCALSLRDGRLLAVTGPRIVPAAGGDSSYAMYGSAVHCWQAAGIALDALEEAVVAVGRYVAATADRPARFHVTGRARIRLRGARPACSAARR
jgi:hypothetical protein